MTCGLFQLTMIIWRLVIIAILYLKLVICNEESYSEALDLRWLPNGDYQALFTFDFTFQSKKDYGTTRHAHFDRFPKVVYDFMHDHVVNEFHLSLTQGRSSDKINYGTISYGHLTIFFTKRPTNIKENSSKFYATFKQVQISSSNESLRP